MTLVSKKEKMQVQAICPHCNAKAIVTLNNTELAKAKKEHGLVQKAVLHEGHVVLIYIDGQCRIRRTYAYTTENTNQINENLNRKTKNIQNSNNIEDLDSLLSHMLKQSLKKDK